jgi:hypothetical protein
LPSINKHISSFTEFEILKALQAKFAAPAWAFIRHARNTTGFSRQVRTADAIAMSLWPSRGLELLGFEVKVSRYDFTRELKDPEKAEEIQQYCDRWWLAVGDAEIVHKGELPPTWGLMELRNSKLRVIAEAPKLTAKPLNRGFLAALLRCAITTTGTEAQYKAIRESAFEDGKAKGREVAERRLQMVATEKTKLEETIAGFEKGAGLSLSALSARFGARKVGEVVKMVLNGGIEKDLESLRGIHAIANSLASSLQQEINAIESLLDAKRGGER